jgi:hypothetical protein
MWRLAAESLPQATYYITLMKIYKAIIWDDDPAKPGRRVSVPAENVQDAKKRLEEEYGEGHVLHNEEDAVRPR